MERKRVSNRTKATVVGGGAGAVVTWLAIEAQRRYGVPAEVGATIIGGAMAWLARWAAKLDPTR